MTQIASTHNWICLHNKRHSPSQQTAFANTTKDIYPRTQRHLPPQPKTFVSSTQGICLHNSRTLRPKTIASTHKGICFHNERYSPPQQTAFAHTTKVIYPRSQGHLPPQPKAFASTTQGICLQHSCPWRYLPLQPNSHASTMPGHSAWKSSTPSKNASRETRHQMAFANTTKGIYPHTQWHLPPQPNSHTSKKVLFVCSEISKNESTAGPIGVHARPL